MKVTAIITHWNTPELLRKQLTLLKPNKDIEVIVVDNKSDESVDWIKRLPKYYFDKNSVNLGYAGGCNSGAKIAKGTGYCFLTPI